MLYRFSKGEPFPSVCEDLGGASPGYQYKWLPLFKNTDGTWPLDAPNAKLAVREIGAKPQNGCWTMMFNAAGVQMYKGDPLTHGGRAACNQEWRRAGGVVTVSDEALGYTHDVSKDHYSPEVPLQFALQRCQFGLLSPEHLPEADAAHLRASRHAAKEPLRQLVDLAVPDLSRQEEIVARIDTTAANPFSREAVRKQKAANPRTHKREHELFLAKMRQILSMAILDAASRPRTFDNTIDYEAKSLVEQHGHQAVYRAISLPDGTWLFAHPLFKSIQQAVTEEEERERSMAIVSPDRRKTASSAASMVVGALAPQLDRMEKKLVSSVDAAACTMQAAVTSQSEAAAREQKAAECEQLGRKYMGITSWLDTPGAVDQFEGYRELHDDDLAVIERCIRDSYDDDLGKAHEATKWIKRLRELLAQGYDPKVAPHIADTLRSTRAQTPPAPTPPPTSLTPPPHALQDDAPLSKRRRLADSPGLPQKTLTECGSIDGLWTEYVGEDGNSGLRQRDAENSKWHGGGGANRTSREMFQDKKFFYREVARQADALGSIAAAKVAVQVRLDGHKKPGRGGWALLKVLTMEQPKNDGTRERLNQLLKSIDVQMLGKKIGPLVTNV